MNIQRLRNLTTGILHTEMGHIYQDLETITRPRTYENIPDRHRVDSRRSAHGLRGRTHYA